jgi:hypothetical protein
MSVLDELWEWIRSPLEEFEKSFTEEPDKSWEARRGEFLQQLGVQEPGQHPVTEQMFRHLDEMTDDERKTHVTSKQFETVAYGFAQQHAASQEAGQGASQASASSAPGYDEQAWQNYLNTNATQWNGTEETWNQFTQWFLYYAEEHSVTTPATQLIDYLNPLPASQRITELARYGVTITPPQAPAAPQTGQPGEPNASAAANQNAASVMDELLAANPEFAAIPEERRIEIMNEALSRVQGAAS